MYEIGRIICILQYTVRAYYAIFLFFSKFMISECYLLWRDVSTLYPLKIYATHTHTRKNKKLLLLSAVYFSLILTSLYTPHIPPYPLLLYFYVFSQHKLHTHYPLTHTQTLSLSLSLSLSLT